MPSPHKKSFAAEQLRRQKKMNPGIIILLVIMGCIVIIGGYVLYSRLSVKDSGLPLTGEKPSIAVTPFGSLSANEEDEVFCDGIHDEIITQLSKISEINVISRGSVMQFKDSNKSIPEIGKELNVTAILEGTVRKSDNRVRITAQLIDVNTDFHLWSDTYDSVLEDIFAIQSDIARKIADALKVELTSSEKNRLEEIPTDNLDAYNYYLRGNDYLHQRSYMEDETRNALQMYQKAIELDPAFALAYSKLSQVYTDMYWFQYGKPEECITGSKEAIDSAMQLDPELPEAHIALGKHYYQCFLNYDRALKQFAIAQKSQPNNSRLYSYTGYVQRRQGKFSEALSNIQKASELDPLAPNLLFEVGLTYMCLQNFSETERYYNRLSAINPDYQLNYSIKAWLYMCWKGDVEKARKLLDEALQKDSSEEERFINLLRTPLEVFEGKYNNALQRIEALPTDSFGLQGVFIPREQIIAQIYGLINNRKLEQAYYDSARVILEDMSDKYQKEARFHGSLGIVYAGLGRREEAVREGKLAVKLMPLSKEALQGSLRLWELAQIYTILGEYDQAIDQLELILSVPSWFTGHWIRIHPDWIPLRDHPRFQKLVASKR